MSQTIEQDLIEAIDKFLADISHQTIVGQPDVVDFTLDLRRIVKPAQEAADEAQV